MSKFRLHFYLKSIFKGILKENTYLRLLQSVRKVLRTYNLSMKIYLAIIYLLRLFQHSTCIDYDGWLHIKFDHTLGCDGQTFCHRGSISLKSIRVGTGVIEQINFNKQNIQELKELAEIDGFYTIRSLVSSAEVKDVEFLSSMKAQAFLENSLCDVISAWVLPNGAVTAVSFQATNMSHPLVQDKDGYRVNSNFFLRYVDQAPVPDTASYIQKLEREREAREKGEVKDTRSFLAKYWMYIIPIAIFVMISGATTPDAPAQASRS